MNQDHIWDAVGLGREDAEVFIDEACARHADDEVANVVDTAFNHLTEGEVGHTSETLRDRSESPCETRCPNIGDVPHPAAYHLYKGSDEVIIVETSAGTTVKVDS